MKKLLATCALGACLLTSTNSFADAPTYNYKVTGTTKVAIGLTAAGLITFFAAKAYHKDSSNLNGLLELYTKKGLALTAIGSGVIVGIFATVNGFKDFEKKEILKEYKKLASLVKTLEVTKTMPATVDFQNLVKRFECSSCGTDTMKGLEFAKVFNAINDLAYEVVDARSFDTKDLNKTLKNERVVQKVYETLGDNYSGSNAKMALKLFSLALVNAYVVSK